MSSKNWFTSIWDKLKKITKNQFFQAIGIIFGAILIIKGAFFPIGEIGDNAHIIYVGFGLILLSLFGPTIKEIDISKGKFIRHIPNEEQRNLAIKLAQDEPPKEIKLKGSKFLEDAEKRPDEKRSPEDYLALATEKWRAKEYDEALDFAYAGLRLNPEDVRIKATLIHRRASIFADLGLKDKAINFYQKAIDLDPNFSLPHINLGVLYAGQGKLEDAAVEIHKAIALDPNFSLPHNNLGQIYFLQERYHEAEREFKEALRLDPNFAHAHNNLGSVYNVQKKYTEAESAYKEALGWGPNLAPVHNNLGTLYAVQGKFEEAERKFKEALRLDPHYAKNFYDLGQLYLIQRRHADAEAKLLKAVELDPNIINAHNNLGILYLNQGKRKEAEMEFLKVLVLNPEFEEARKNLKKLW